MSTANSTGPTHYRRGSIEVWDFIHDQGLNYFLGNAIKYICRAGYKESKIQDLQKAIHYLQKELELAQSTQQPTEHANPVYKPHSVFGASVFGTPPIPWTTGTDIQDSDGFSLGEAG